MNSIAPFLFLLLAGWTLSLSAQVGLHQQFLRSHASSQQFQPANILYHDLQTASISGDGAFWLNTNAFTLDAILADGNFISEESKDQIMEQLSSSGNQLQQGIPFSYGMLNLKFGDQRWSISFNDRQSSISGANNPDLVGLFLYGNARYAGQSVSDEDVFSHVQRYRELAIGTGFDFGKVKLGVRGKLALGYEAVVAENVDISVLTAEDGSSIQLTADYDIKSALNGRNESGIGGGVDLGLVFEATDKLKLHFSALDLGVISWDGYRYDNEIDVLYEGLDINDLLGVDIASGQFVGIDSLQALIVPDSSQESFTTLMPMSFHLGAEYQLSEHGKILGSVHSRMSGYGGASSRPIVNVAYHHTLWDVLTLGANAYGGGMELWGVGVMGRANVLIKEAFRIDVFAASDNVLGVLAPSASKSVNISAGVNFVY